MTRMTSAQKYFCISIFTALFCVIAIGTARADMPDNDIPLSKVARIKTLRFNTKDIHATAQYPVFAGDTLVARYANWKVRVFAEQTYHEFLKRAKDNVAAFKKINGHVTAPLEFELTANLWNYQPSRVISLSFDIYSYTGGAHPFGFTRPFTFGMVGDRPRELVLGDLFNPDGDYRTRIETDILARLKKTGRATWVDDGTVTHLTTDQLNSFVLTNDSVCWFFPPYDMGPYVSGAFEIQFTPAQMGAGFDESWLKPRTAKRP